MKVSVLALLAVETAFLLVCVPRAKAAQSAACGHFVQQAVGQNPDSDFHTDQLVVMRGDGTMLMNWTDGTFKKSTPHTQWSVSKTVTASLVAAAVLQNKMSIDDPVTKYVPLKIRTVENGAAKMSAMKVRDLLAMTSGFRWNEHPDDSAQTVSVLPMMYSVGYRDFTKYIMNLDFSAAPGKQWNYSSANGALAMAVLKKIYGAGYDDMPWKNLFDPLGIKSARIEQDAAGLYLGSMYVYLSAEDMAKVGLLYLNDGLVNGKRILPEGWVDFSQELVPESLVGIHKPADYKHFGPYSKGSWWLNTKIAGAGKPYPKSPESMYVAEGLMGQWIIVLPEQNMVVARTAHDGDTTELIDMVASGAVACFGNGSGK